MLKDRHDTNCGSAVVVGPRNPIFPWCDESQQTTPAGSRQERSANAPSGGNPRDLCCICSYVAECMYRSTADRPKLECELFDVDVSALNMRDSGPAQNELREAVAPDLTGGLCCNCENRRHCTIRKAEGNVWHCEEYC